MTVQTLTIIRRPRRAFVLVTVRGEHLRFCAEDERDAERIAGKLSGGYCATVREVKR